MAPEAPRFRYSVSGAAKGKGTLVFVHGWPDNGSLWDEYAAALGKNYRTIQIDILNYGSEVEKRLGITHEEIVQRLKNTVDHAQGGDASTNPVTLVVHDWGAFWGYQMATLHPKVLDRIVGIDIGAHVTPTPKEGLFVVWYQWTLAFAFLIAQIPIIGLIGHLMTQAMSLLMKAPRGTNVNAFMNYPYLYLWFNILTRKRMPMYKCTHPTLFIYGTKKPVMFHSNRWLESVKKSTNGQVVGLEGGHWIMKDQPEEFLRVVQRWLA